MNEKHLDTLANIANESDWICPFCKSEISYAFTVSFTFGDKSIWCSNCNLEIGFIGEDIVYCLNDGKTLYSPEQFARFLKLKAFW